MQAGEPWVISLFGGLQIAQNGRVVEKFRSQKMGALLAYLALSHRSYTREELADLFWPDCDMEAGRANLRTALAALRRATEGDGPALLERGESTLRLVPGSFVTDVARFERALTQAHLPATSEADRVDLQIQAVNLYTGPLLPGVYEAWALSERDRLAERYHATLLHLASHFEKTGAYADALVWARRSVADDPLRDLAHAAIVRLLILSGQAGAARRHYQEVERVLGAKLGVAPSPEMQAALKAVRPVAPVVPPVAIHTATPAPSVSQAENTEASVAEETMPVPDSAPQTRTGRVLLPVSLNAFFGREAEMRQLTTLLTASHTRLVTVTGAGGAGKTRITIEAARETSQHFTGGVWFVSLADLREPERLLSTIANTLKIPRSTNTNPQEQVVFTLNETSEPTLLVLDNFEQLVDGGAGPIAELLARVPHLVCLVSSRQPLLVEGEQEFALGLLPIPTFPGSPERLAEFAGVQLFVHRAQATRPDFALTEQNAPSVALLCAQLEGWPLALELAAAWSKTLTPAQMVERLSTGTNVRRFDFLVSRRRDTPERHSTLRATLQWSWDLLRPELQEFFAALSVFHGGWTLEAAEFITNEANALSLLTELCERSLIYTEEVDPDGPHLHEAQPVMRFGMRVLLREFACEQLQASGNAQNLRERHLAYFAEFARQAAPHVSGPEQLPYLQALEIDHENLRAALEFATEHTPEKAVPLTRALIRFWIRHGHKAEGLQRVEKVLAHVSDPALRVRILPTASWLAWYLFTPGTRLIAKRYAEEGLAISRDTNDKRGEAICLGTLGQIAHHENQPETARQLHNQAVELSRDFTDTWLRGHCLRGLASVLLPQGYVEEAQAVMKQAVDELRQSGDRYAVAVVLREAGVVFASTHKRPLAKEYLQESIALSEQLRDNGNVGLASLVLGYCAGDAGEYAQARAYFDTALRSCRESGNRYGLAHALMNRAYTFLGENAPEGAARDLSESLHLFSEFGNGGDIAMALEAMARVALAQQNWKRVTTLFAAAVTLRASVGSTMLGDDVVRYENEVAQAKTYLCPDEYEVAYAHGASLSALQAVDYALQEPLLRASN